MWGRWGKKGKKDYRKKLRTRMAMPESFVFILPLEDRPGNRRKPRWFSFIFMEMSPILKVGGIASAFLNYLF